MKCDSSRYLGWESLVSSNSDFILNVQAIWQFVELLLFYHKSNLVLNKQNISEETNHATSSSAERTKTSTFFFAIWKKQIFHTILDNKLTPFANQNENKFFLQTN